MMDEMRLRWTPWIRRAAVILVALLANGAAAFAQLVPLGEPTRVDGSPDHFYACPVLAARETEGLLAYTPFLDGRAQGVRAIAVTRDGGAGQVFDVVSGVDSAAESLALLRPGYLLTSRAQRPAGLVHLAARLAQDGRLVAGPRDLRLPWWKLSARPGGGFVALRGTPAGLVIQVLDGAARPVGAAVVVRSAQNASVAHAPDGRFVVAWSESRGTRDRGVFGLTYSATGEPARRARRLAPPRGDLLHHFFELAVGRDGTIAVLDGVVPRLSDPGSVVLRTFDWRGHALGTHSITASAAAGFPSYPQSVAVSPRGSVIALWSQEGRGGYDDLDALAREYGRDAQPRGPALSLRGPQNGRAIQCGRAAAMGDGWLVSWIEATIPSDVETSVEEVWVRTYGE